MCFAGTVSLNPASEVTSISLNTIAEGFQRMILYDESLRSSRGELWDAVGLSREPGSEAS